MATDTSIGAPFAVPGGWECLPLDQLVDRRRGISYGIVQPGSHEPSGVPIVRVGDVRKGRVDVNDVLRVAAAIESAHERTRLQGGEVLLSLVGTLGECAVAPEHLRGWNVARAIGVIPLATGINPDWVAICLRSSPVQALMKAWSTTTVQATLNLREVRRLPILMPPALLRAQITETACALENKIEQNRRTAQALEGLAQAIFRAWFVDFEPVKAKAAGASGFLSMPKAVFDALPSRFVDSETGPIPEEWRLQGLADVATFLNGLALQKYPPRHNGRDLPVIKIAELRKGSTAGGDLANNDVPADYVIADRDLLFSWSGTLEAAIWFGGRGALNQHLFKVTSPHFPSWFCLHSIREHLPWFRAIAKSKATTMGHIKRSHLHEAKVVVPDALVMRNAEVVLGPICDLHAQLSIESRGLASTRDYLLPRLLTGQLRPGSA